MAATERSWPTPSWITTSASAASGDSGAFVIAIVGRPWAWAAASTPTTSCERPDCEMARTAAPGNAGGWWPWP